MIIVFCRAKLSLPLRVQRCPSNVGDTVLLKCVCSNRNERIIQVAPVNVDKESDEYLAKVKLMRQLKRFWKQQAEEIDRSGTDPSEFKSQQLPLARIKKVC